jgi:hypothetical protein
MDQFLDVWDTWLRTGMYKIMRKGKTCPSGYHDINQTPDERFEDRIYDIGRKFLWEEGKEIWERTEVKNCRSAYL